VVETAGNHISRLRVHLDGSLTDRQVCGPEDLGGWARRCRHFVHPYLGSQ